MKYEFQMKRKHYLEWIIGNFRHDNERDLQKIPLSNEDWQNIYKVAVDEGVAPYLYYRLKESALNLEMPPEIREKFIEISRYVLAKNTTLFHELGRVLRGLFEKDIKVIVLKGSFLSEAVYPHNGLRPMSDIDLLVCKKDLIRVQKELLEMGYHQKKQMSIEEQCVQSHHLNPFFNERAIKIEIHWNLSAHLLEINEVIRDGIWKRARHFRIAGVDTLILSPEDLLLHLCIHTSLHHLFKNWLKAFCDIAETARYFQDEINWDKLFRYAHEMNLDRFVYTTLFCVSDLFGVKSHTNALVKFRPENFNQEKINLVKDSIFEEFNKTPLQDRNFANVWCHQKTGIRRLFHIFRVVFLPKNELAGKYNVRSDSKTVYLLYLVRIKDIMLKYSRSVLHLFFHDKELMSSIEKTNKRNELREWLRS